MTRHGKVVWYVRIGKGARIRLRGEYGTPEFVSAYQSAVSGKSVPNPQKPATGTLACHTTVRTGPYTAVREVALTRVDQGGETERLEVGIGESDGERFAPGDVPWTTAAVGRIASDTGKRRHGRRSRQPRGVSETTSFWGFSNRLVPSHLPRCRDQPSYLVVTGELRRQRRLGISGTLCAACSGGRWRLVTSRLILLPA
jgi:hypothetical protein